MKNGPEEAGDRKVLFVKSTKVWDGARAEEMNGDQAARGMLKKEEMAQRDDVQNQDGRTAKRCRGLEEGVAGAWDQRVNFFGRKEL